MRRTLIFNQTEAVNAAFVFLADCRAVPEGLVPEA
jgi:hypothetical protein